jgi:membrane-bound lytic murein transglycosylase B
VSRPAALVLIVLLLQHPGFSPVHAQSAQNRSSSPSPASQDVLIGAPEPFDVWLDKLIAEARARGFSEQLISDTLAGLQPLTQVVRNDRNQAELNPGFPRYLSSHLSAALIQRGHEMVEQHATLLRQLEDRFGVPGPILVALWGIETQYGRITGRTPVFRALATLAWEPRRAEYFRGELFQALMMVDRGYIDAASMTGSWAGAMGQTQFMPSSYMSYAVDFDGDGHRDIWRSTPDALASIANYLKGFGWTPGRSWGREVRVPADAQAYINSSVPRRTEGCYALRNMTERLPMSVWRDVGVTTLDGAPVPAVDVAAGLVDVGERKFLVYPNYDAILGYNCAHYYALTAAILAETIGPPESGAFDTATPRVAGSSSTASTAKAPAKRGSGSTKRSAPKKKSR